MSKDKASHSICPLPEPAQLDLAFNVPTPLSVHNAAGQPDNVVDTPSVELTAEEALKAFVEEVGVEPFVVDCISRMAVGALLAWLHKEALTSERQTHGLLHQCCSKYGVEAGFHLCGILEASKLEEPGEVWEILSHTLSSDEWKPFEAVTQQWMAERSAARKALDENRRDRKLDEEFARIRFHPQINKYGLIFLESLAGQVTLARDLFRSGVLLEMVLTRQKMAEDYVMNAVCDLGEDLQLAQREAEREYLLIPDEVTAPNLSNWGNS